MVLWLNLPYAIAYATWSTVIPFASSSTMSACHQGLSAQMYRSRAITNLTRSAIMTFPSTVAICTFDYHHASLLGETIFMSLDCYLKRLYAF